MREDHWIGGEGAESSMRARLRLEAMEWHEEALLLVDDDDDDDESLSSSFTSANAATLAAFAQANDR